jgi:hypothetical protein
MIAIVRTMAARLHDLDPSIEEEKLQQVRMHVAPESAPVADATSETASEVQTESTAVASEVEKPPAPPAPETQEFAPCKSKL